MESYTFAVALRYECLVYGCRAVEARVKFEKDYDINKFGRFGLLRTIL